MAKQPSGLSLYLREGGLDNVQFWLINLEEINILSLASFKLMEGDIRSFKQLEGKANYVERKALAKLLKIDENIFLSKPDLPSISSSTEEILKYVKNWSKEKWVTAEQVQQWLQFLWKIKQNCNRQASQTNIWVTEYLMNPFMQEFLINIVEYNLEKPAITSVMQNIIDKDDLSHLNGQIFPQIHEISNWLYPSSALKAADFHSIADLDSFENFLANTIQGELMVRKPKSPDILAMHISKGIYHLRFHCKNTYSDIFLIILTYPFLKDAINDVITLKPLKINELQFFYKNFCEQKINMKTYKEINLLLLQTYFFLLAIYSCSEKNKQNQLLFIKQIFQRTIELQPSLEIQLKIVLKNCFLNSNLESLMNDLKNILVPPCQSRPENIYLSGKTSSDFVVDRNLEAINAKYKTLSYYQDKFSELSKNEEAHELLETLGLCCYYPKKLSLSIALCIREEPMKISLDKIVITSSKQLAFLVLDKLMSYDGLCRSDLIPVSSHDSDCASSDGSESDGEKSSKQINTTEPESGVYKLEIHPVDILLSLLLISDDILCQDLLSRLAKCQFSIPLVIPNPFTNALYVPIWAMNSILHEWKSTTDDTTVQYNGPIIQYPTPIVSFIRIGEHKKYSPSKSKILNEVIGDSHHDYFFHRDCRGGQYKTILGQGLIDMTWYVPSGKTDIFSDAITFLNLHGDAKEYPEQCLFLSKCSFMCIILLTEKDQILNSQLILCLKDLYSSAGGVCILNCVEEYPPEFEKILPKPSLINLVSKKSIKKAAEIKDALQVRIKKKLKHAKGYKSIKEHVHINKKENIVTDEDSEVLKLGSASAKKIKEIVCSYKRSDQSLKDLMLPLQGKNLWKAWAFCNQKIYRQKLKENELIHDTTVKIEDTMSKLRSDQLEYVRNLNSFTKAFIESLSELNNDDSVKQRNCFLQILKLEFNSLSRDSITEKQYKYHTIRKELSKIQNPQNSDLKEEIIKLKRELEVLQDEIIDSSLGLEHVFRELGQIYEASREGILNNHDKSFNDILEHYILCLPKLVAKLVAEGHPFELMDGDAAHIPLEWVTAVISEVVKILGDPKIFILSVLGLQSTGKSTLLNSTFGLQFNVSAGRCTRGAFMQLLPLDEHLHQATGCSYVMIVDTEGLRAPELDLTKTQNHDNELATFVIGLANTTLINIFGEVPGDIDDILQTSVHAFLRMNLVKFYPSCQFVHHNAGVSIKGEVGRAKFTQKLNKFTVDAAQEEHCEGYETFNDVIKFNDQTDVHYFPGLWKGDPPMAPVNQGYSQSAQLLKHHVLEIICKRAGLDNPSTSEYEELDYHNLSSFKLKLSDLWTTLLKENFVFSFKNTLEITAYNSLETAYNKWEWTVQSAMLKWEQQAENEISTESSETLNAKVELKLTELNIYVSKTLFDPIKAEMDLFFKGKQSEILIQWKSKIELRFKFLLKEVKIHAEFHCKNLLSRKKVISEFDADRQINVEFIKKQVQQWIDRVRGEQERLYQSIESGKLSAEDLKKLVAKQLFTTRQLSRFVEDKIITSEQVTKIMAKMSQNRGRLNEEILVNILKANILTLEQVKKILIKTHQNEFELQSMFDEIWKDLMKQLPRVQPVRHTSIEYAVESTLYKHLGGTTLHGHLIAKLKKKTLRDRGLKITLTIKNKHYANNYGVIGRTSHQLTRYIFNTSDPFKIQAIDANNKILKDASQYLESKCKEDIDFNTMFIQELLQLMDRSITAHSSQDVGGISFTPTYRLDVYMIVCGYAIVQFEIMAKKFEDKNDPKLYLEKHQKIPLFIKFKNQYKLTEAEEAIADTFCAYLDEPIKTQVEKSLGAKMVDKMKASQYHQFANKMALKVTILRDLYKKNDFSEYMLYIKDIGKCLREQIKGYTIKYCDENVANSEKTQLQITAEEEVIRLVDVVETIICNANEPTVQELLRNLCNDTDLRKELGVDLRADDLLAGYESLENLNVNSLKPKIINRLQSLQERCQETFKKIKCETAMENWKDKPHDLLKSLIGCTSQCPFCKEQCDLLEHDESCDHRTEVHRITCLAGWRTRNTGKMVTSICPMLIAGDGSFYPTTESEESVPYKYYKTIYPRWFIPPDVVAKSCSYWKWFVASHREELEKEYDADGSNFPTEWLNIKWSSLKQDLQSVYNLNL